MFWKWNLYMPEFSFICCLSETWEDKKKRTARRNYKRRAFKTFPSKVIKGALQVTLQKKKSIEKIKRRSANVCHQSYTSTSTTAYSRSEEKYLIGHFQSTHTNPRFQKKLGWLSELDNTRPDYRVKLFVVLKKNTITHDNNSIKILFRWIKVYFSLEVFLC